MDSSAKAESTVGERCLSMMDGTLIDMEDAVNTLGIKIGSILSPEEPRPEKAASKSAPDEVYPSYFDNMRAQQHRLRSLVNEVRILICRVAL